MNEQTHKNDIDHQVMLLDREWTAWGASLTATILNADPRVAARIHAEATGSDYVDYDYFRDLQAMVDFLAHDPDWHPDLTLTTAEQLAFEEAGQPGSTGTI